MPNPKINKIQLNSTTYDLEDAAAQQSIESLQQDVSGLQQDIAQKEHFRGYFATTAEVQAIENPSDGDFAWNAQTGTVWNYTTTWTNSGEAIPDQTVQKSSSTPLMDGTASAGSSNQYAAGDHRHPTDTTRASAQALADETSARQDADSALGGRITELEGAGFVKASYAADTETLVLSTS